MVSKTCLFARATVLLLTALIIPVSTVADAADSRPLIVAHRGASKHAPENTLPAFKLAWEQGADAIEGDFMLTGDGHIVCIHDKTTKRTAGVDLNVNQSTLSELRELDVGSWFNPDCKGTRIPTIAEVLATVPAGKKIYIEIKCGTEIIPALLPAVRKSGLNNEQIVFLCFNQTVLEQLKKQAPEYAASWLVSFKKNKEDKIKPAYDAVIKTLGRIKPDGLSTGHSLVDADFIQRVHKLGVQHHVWTVNDGPTAKRFAEWGTRSISTDDPETIQKALEVISVR